MRVIEDTARFVVKKDGIYKRVRGVRHSLDILTRDIYPMLLKERKAGSDPGRKIKEGRRDGIKSILISNFKRVEESLRVLEEYGKLISADSGSKFKKIRFQIYNIEKSLLA